MKVATGSADSLARIWDVRTRQPAELLSLAGHESSVMSVAFSPDGRSSSEWLELLNWIDHIKA